MTDQVVTKCNLKFRSLLRLEKCQILPKLKSIWSTGLCKFDNRTTPLDHLAASPDQPNGLLNVSPPLFWHILRLFYAKRISRLTLLPDRVSLHCVRFFGRFGNRGVHSGRLPGWDSNPEISRS